MGKLLYAAIVLAACSLGGCQSISPFTPGSDAAEQPPASASQAAAAQQGLATFVQLVNAGNYAALGFGSPEEVRQASLGAPMQIYRVGLDALRGLKQDSNPETLLVDARRSLYPVEVQQRTASSIFVTQAPDGWRASDMGSAAVARAVTRYRNSPTDFIVHVPALQIYFVARRSEGRLLLTPVMDDPRTDFKAGVSLPADEAFRRLQKPAQDYNGLPQ